MRIIHPHQYRIMPWKNGGGTTTEIAAFPEGASLGAFGWRISMAHVASDGPFSLFPGIDRTLCVLDGMGITLQFAGKGEVTLGKMSDPYSFAADAPCEAKLHGEPIDDLNVMTRRGQWRHGVERLDIFESFTITAASDYLALVCRGCKDDATLLLERGETFTCDATPRAAIFAVKLDRDH